MAVVAALALWGSDDASRDELIGRTILGAVAIIALPFVYIWRTASIPAEWDAEKESQIAALKEREVPKIEISDPIEKPMPGAMPRQHERWFQVEVVNKSTTTLRNCSLREVSLVNRYDHAAEVTGRTFRLSSERYADMKNHTYQRFFDLRGGESERLEIAQLSEHIDIARVIMLYATEKTAPQMNAIPRSFFPHVLTVQATADNLAAPVRKSFLLAISPEGQLEVTVCDPTIRPSTLVSAPPPPPSIGLGTQP